MTIKITSPVEGLNLETYLGPLKLTFEDGVAKVDELNDGQRAYLYGAGYKIDGESIKQPEPDQPIDSRDASEIQTVGTPLRDAAVDPQPGDFLAPVNAGDADPHGPEVASPGIHAVAGPGPIVPGTVGSKDYQDAKESATAEAVLVDNMPATEVGAALGTLAAEEYKLTDEDGFANEVASLDRGDVDQVIEDGPPAGDELKGAALDKALEAANLSKSGTADEKRTRLAEYRSKQQV